MWRDPGVRASLAMCHLHKALLYQARPDLFPEGILTDTEMELWGLYLESIKKR